MIDKNQHNEHPQTTPDFYIIGKVLGKGAFGKVNLCLHKLSGKLIAMKSLHKQYLESEHNKAKFHNEIAIQGSVGRCHPKSVTVFPFW